MTTCTSSAVRSGNPVARTTSRRAVASTVAVAPSTSNLARCSSAPGIIQCGISSVPFVLRQSFLQTSRGKATRSEFQLNIRYRERLLKKLANSDSRTPARPRPRRTRPRQVPPIRRRSWAGWRRPLRDRLRAPARMRIARNPSGLDSTRCISRVPSAEY